ncbi:MAG: 7-cyano-7-deazaguanine synthase QueC [Gemmatimonadota bacterium]
MTCAPVALLLSGGMDSATCLWWIRAHRTAAIHTVSIDYGQRHRVELEYAARLSARAGALRHHLLRLDLAAIGGSPLTDPGLEVPAASEGRQVDTVVPFRNLLFVAAAAACAETCGIDDLYLGPVRDDRAAYRDCRREFYDSLEQTLRLGASRERPVRVLTPFVDLWKREVVALGLGLGVPYELTHTCYTGRRPACGRCDACAERLAAFRAHGVADPLDYAVGTDCSPPE